MDMIKWTLRSLGGGSQAGGVDSSMMIGPFWPKPGPLLSPVRDGFDAV
jgi:hypothetical protein